MGDFLRLANVDGSTVINLLTDTIQLARGGYQPNTATQRPDGSYPLVTETIALLGEGTPAEIMLAEAAIHELLEYGRLWHAKPWRDLSTWIEFSVDGEPGATTDPAKRALVYRGALQLGQPDGFAGGFLRESVFATLALTRHPFFENYATKELDSVSEVGNLGGTWDISAGAPGDVPARMLEVNIDTHDAFNQIWIGIRPFAAGISDFDPLWNLEDGSNRIADTTDVVDATASGGSKCQCTFATDATLTERIRIRLDDVLGSGDYDHFCGRYLVLGRMKLSATPAQAGVRIRYGMASSAASRKCEEVYITDATSWLLYELGEIQIPPDTYRHGVTSAADLDAFAIWVDAERLSGSASLDMDALVLIPAEHMITAKGLDPASRAEVLINTAENDLTTVRLAESGFQGNPEYTVKDWVMPIDPGVVVYAQQFDAHHDLGAYGGTIVIDYFPRWRLFRGEV